MTPTEKLYYKYPYLQNTTARILDVRKTKNTWSYAFDRTIFYPGGGGQSTDEGLINGSDLKNITEEDGVIWHDLNTELTGNVKMELNWPLRSRRMQQHTGQHLISAVLYREYGINTVSVHLGQTVTLIEFDASDIPHTILKEAEDKINAKIREHITVKSHWVPWDRLTAYDLRRDVKVESDPARLIAIGSYDVTGCGGTHVSETSEIGLIKIIGTEKIRKHTRVHFRIGESAYQFFGDLVDIMQNISQNLSSGYNELDLKIAKVIDENRDLRKTLNKMRKNWLQLRAEQLISQGNSGFFVLSDLSQNDLVDISLYWYEKFKKPCLFICKHDKKYYFVIRMILESGISAVNFIRSSGDQFNLRGGGSDDFVQGVIVSDFIDKEYVSGLKDGFNRHINRKQVK